MANIVKDTDTTILLTVTDENATPIDLTTLAGYVVEVFQKNILFDKFSKNTQAGFRDINETDGTNGKFEIYLNAENTKNGVIGKEVFFEVKTLTVDANFDNGTNETSTGVQCLGELVRSELKRETFV